MYRCPGSPKDSTGLETVTVLTFLRRTAILPVSQLMSSNGLISRYKCPTKYLIFLQPQAFCDALYARNSFSAGAPPRPRWGSSRRSPRPPSRLGRGKPPPHSPPPRRLRRLDFGVPNFISRKLATLCTIQLVLSRLRFRLGHLTMT